MKVRFHWHRWRLVAVQAWADNYTLIHLQCRKCGKQDRRLVNEVIPESAIEWT